MVDQQICGEQRKSVSEKQTAGKSRNPQMISETNSIDNELNDLQNTEMPKPKRPKRQKKSVNENLEPAFTATPTVAPENSPHPPPHEFGYGSSRSAAEQNLSMSGNT